MKKLPLILMNLCVVLVLSNLLQAREWKSAKGDLTIDGEMIAHDGKLVVIKKPTGELAAMELKDLSSEDQEFVHSTEADQAKPKSADEMQTWTTKDGMKIRGQVMAYGSKEVVVQRNLGKVYFDGKEFSTIDNLHQRVILRVMSQLENTKFEDQKSLEQWARNTLRGEPRRYKLDGVLMHLESGDEVSVPFFMFSPEDLKILQPGWELWQERKESEESREKESFLMRAAAMNYQRDRAEQRQIEMIKLDLLGAATGVVDIWQVGIMPRQGVIGRPTSVMVAAQNSQAAVARVLAGHPGWEVVGVRKASRY